MRAASVGRPKELRAVVRIVIIMEADLKSAIQRLTDRVNALIEDVNAVGVESFGPVSNSKIARAIIMDFVANPGTDLESVTRLFRPYLGRVKPPIPDDSAFNDSVRFAVNIESDERQAFDDLLTKLNAVVAEGNSRLAFKRDHDTPVVMSEVARHALTWALAQDDVVRVADLARPGIAKLI